MSMMLDNNSALGLLGNQDWRLRNLYKIKDKEGRIVDFEPNWAQMELKKPHYLNIVLKARQLGITTYHAILFLDTCLFNHNVNCAIVADSKPIAREIFLDKVKFALLRLMKSSLEHLMPSKQVNLFASSQQQEAVKATSLTSAKKLRHYKMQVKNQASLTGSYGSFRGGNIQITSSIQKMS